MPDELSGPPAAIPPAAALPVLVDDTLPAPSLAPMSPPPLDLSDPLFAPDDTRYRRPLFVRWLRALGQWCWIILAAYPLTGIYNFIGALNAGQPFSLHTAGQAFYLDRIVPAVIAQPLDAAPPLAAVALLAFIARGCFLDHRRERAEIERRAKRDQRRTEDQALEERAKRAAEGAAIGAAGAIGVAAVNPIIERAGEIGHEVGGRAVQPLLDTAEEAGKRAGEAAAPPIAAAVIATVDEAMRNVPVLLTAELERQGIAIATASAALPSPPPFDVSLLPVPETFVGRAADLAWVKERLIQGGATAITALGGIGGIGKSALAGVVVRELAAEGRFRGGVAVVGCAEKTDAAGILLEVLADFNGGKTPDVEGDAALGAEARKLLREKDALIVLDNVEPELKDVARVVAPLREAGATLLLTARHDLPAAAVPPGSARRLDVLEPDEARALFTQLFTAAARRVLEDGEIAAVASIVQTLGRHTLAIHLAANYASGTKRDLAKLAAELAADPLKLPADDKTPRGVALVLGRSVDALSAEAQQLFAALAAFATTEFGRNAALALGNALEIAEPETALDLLIHRALLDATLEARMPEGSDRERLSLHPLLRAYAADLAGDDRDTARRAVAVYYVTYAREVPDAALVPDEANITGALDWAHKDNQDALIAAIADAMSAFWRDRGKTRDRKRYLPLGLTAAQRVAESHQEHDDWLRLARLQLAYADLLQLFGNLTAAAEYIHQSLALRLREHDQRGEGIALSKLGDILRQRGDLAGAQSNYEAYRRIMREVGDTREEGVALSKLGDILVQRGDLAGAQSNYEQVLRIMREVGDTREEGVALSKLGQIALKRGRLDEAAGYFSESLTIHREVQDRQGEGVALAHLGMIAAAVDELDAAEGYYRDCLEVMREVQDALNEAAIALILGQFLIERRHDHAEQLHRASLDIAVEVQAGQDIADSLLTLGQFLIIKRDKREEGCAMLREAVALYHEMGVPGEDEARAVARALGCDAG